jgi:hypothetical protein
VFFITFVVFFPKINADAILKITRRFGKVNAPYSKPAPEIT